MKFDKSRVNKILIIKPGAIGDVLLSTPVIENLRISFPGAEINYLTQTFCREVLTDNPYLSRVLTYDLKKGDSSYCLIKNVHDQKYDLIIDLFCNPRTAVIVFNSDAKYRVGFPFSWRRFAYNIKVKPRSSEIHNVEFNLDTLRALNLEVTVTRPQIYLNHVHREFAAKFLAQKNPSNDKIIGINPSGTWETKVWYREKFTELASKLSEANKILIFWGYEKEKEEAEKIQKSVGNRAILIPSVNLKFMSAFVEKCSLFITNDTGPMHIAWTLGVNVAALFGPTNPDLQGPRSKNSVVVRNERLNCLGCNLTKISDCPYQHKCMADLSPDEVLKKIRTKFGEI